METHSWLSDRGNQVLLDHLQDGIFVVEDDTLVFVNQRLADMLQYPVSALIGRPFIELVAIEDQPYIMERHLDRLAGKNVPKLYDIRLTTFQGLIICCSINVGLTENQRGHIVTVGSARDITLQKAALVELETSRAELKSILDQLPDVLYRTNMQGIITMISPSCFDVIGYLQSEMIGTAMANYYETPAGRQKIVQAITDGGGKATQVETSLRRKDGSIIWISTNAFVRFGSDSQPIYVEGMARDITARINAENQLHNSVRKLEEKELAKTRFLAAAGHDLRQPVTAANLFLEALKLTSPTPQQSKLIGRLDQSMNIFSGLLERLLDISKFDAGVIKAQPTSFNLSELFSWLEQNFAQGARRKKLSFRSFFPTRSKLVVHTDVGLLQSVVMNLVSNAIKFTHHGGILISARPRANRVLLQVWDTGIGISAIDIPHIYEEFHQLANPQRNREDGLGLGLSICQRAMALLGGEVTCRSIPGKGSVFAITLPLDVERSQLKNVRAASTETKHPNNTLLNHKRFVVVEDDVLVADGLVSLLHGLGAEVLHFKNAEEALNFAGLSQSDFFIVDYSLGGKLSGLEFLTAVQLKLSKPIRAVVCTGETSSQLIAKISDSPWPVLFKPISYAKLSSAMSQGILND